MRRIVIGAMGTVTGVALLFGYRAGSIDLGGTGTSGGAVAEAAADGSGATTVTGDAVSTEYGDVQVEITVEDGAITAAEAVAYPTGDHHSEQINAYAVPQLEQETVDAGDADIDAVSGATITSDAYVESLQSAIDAAGL